MLKDIIKTKRNNENGDFNFTGMYIVAVSVLVFLFINNTLYTIISGAETETLPRLENGEINYYLHELGIAMLIIAVGVCILSLILHLSGYSSSNDNWKKYDGDVLAPTKTQKVKQALIFTLILLIVLELIAVVIFWLAHLTGLWIMSTFLGWV